MYILTLADKVEGVFSVIDEDGDQIIPIFEDSDDAERYNGMMVMDATNPNYKLSKSMRN